MKNRIHKIIAMLLTVIMVISFTPSTHADETGEWNGISPLQSGHTYTVSDRVLLRSNITIPADTEIIVKNGGQLVIPAGVNITLIGKITIQPDGQLFVSGILATRPISTLDIYGTMLGSLSSNISIVGHVTVHEGALVRTSGNLSAHTNSRANNYGEIRYLNSGTGTINSNFINHAGALLRIAGRLTVSFAGQLENSGTIIITDNGFMQCEGIMIMQRHSHFNRLGRFEIGVEGEVIDNRNIDPFLLSPQSILREPAVVIHGIDVSFWQGDIDWETVSKTDIEFAILRAGRGRLDDERPIAEDTRFREYIADAQKHGLEVGVYFYSYAYTVEEIVEEAHFLVELLSEFQLTYPVVLDMEETRSYYTDNPSEMADAFLTIIAQAGYYPMFYSYKSWLERNLTQEIRDKYAVWVAHWDVPATTYAGQYLIWQYTETGRVSGIRGNVDLNIAYRDFAAYIKKHQLNNLR
jgi:GH25 family lysozyme M1 (1,4-beta-N-acetylmuramidase)